MRFWSNLSALLVVAVLGGVPASSYATPILVSDGSPCCVRANFDGTVGTRFLVGANDIVINALGFEDKGLDGLVSTHRVGIWLRTGGPVLAEVTVLAGTGSALDDVWRYESIGSAITLLAGVEYVIGAELFIGGDAFTDSGSGTAEFSFSPGVSGGSGSDNSASLPGFHFPSSNGDLTDLRWGPANATFLVPEPATLALLGFGLAGVGFSRRKTM